MRMRLNTAKQLGTVMDMGGRGGTDKAPREKRGGISLPVHVWKGIDTMVALRTAAFKKMGGENKASTSDEIELAMRSHIRKHVKKYGPLPVLGENKAGELVVGEREQKTVAQMAESMGIDAVANLNDVSGEDDDEDDVG